MARVCTHRNVPWYDNRILHTVRRRVLMQKTGLIKARKKRLLLQHFTRPWNLRCISIWRRSAFKIVKIRTNYRHRRRGNVSRNAVMTTRERTCLTNDWYLLIWYIIHLFLTLIYRSWKSWKCPRSCLWYRTHNEIVLAYIYTVTCLLKRSYKYDQQTANKRFYNLFNLYLTFLSTACILPTFV